MIDLFLNTLVMNFKNINEVHVVRAVALWGM